MIQGRGSAANSAACYVLGITAVDPVRMELLFERFLSEERVQNASNIADRMPDIDLDLPSGDGARADDPARLRQVRAARRRHDRQRDHLPPADGGARRRPRAGVLRGAARPHLQAPARLDRRRGSSAHRLLRDGGVLAARAADAPRRAGRHRAPQSAAPPRPALGRDGALGRLSRRGGAAGAGRHGQARRRPVGQGRLRRSRPGQGRSPRPRHDGGAGRGLSARRAARGDRARLRQAAARRSEGLRHAARRRHRRRVPGRVARADGDAAAHEAGALLRSGRRGGDHPPRPHRRQDAEPLPRTAEPAARSPPTRTRRWSRS